MYNLYIHVLFCLFKQLKQVLWVWVSCVCLIPCLCSWWTCRCPSSSSMLWTTSTSSHPSPPLRALSSPWEPHCCWDVSSWGSYSNLMSCFSCQMINVSSEISNLQLSLNSCFTPSLPPSHGRWCCEAGVLPLQWATQCGVCKGCPELHPSCGQDHVPPPALPWPQLPPLPADRSHVEGSWPGNKVRLLCHYCFLSCELSYWLMDSLMLIGLLPPVIVTCSTSDKCVGEMVWLRRSLIDSSWMINPCQAELINPSQAELIKPIKWQMAIFRYVFSWNICCGISTFPP